ncbi:hypothetical protein ACLHDG_05000 [Sulfurovum sp. CS9]|uniref:hypothetical protein n=1 Tax=Sulfurovum sp. CS9 TaxID=3391146 RepID=UPI0039ECBDE2
MRRNQKVSTILFSSKRNNQFRIFFTLIFFIFTITTTHAITRNNPEKWAIMFLDPDIEISSVKTLFENFSISVPMSQDRIWYESQGYKVFVAYGSDEIITRAILDERVKSISYYGHGGGTRPTFGERDAQSWKSVIFGIYLRKYRNQGLSQKNAFNLANAQSQNFGLQNVVNRSCGSLYNTSLADLFVTPGNSYYGSLAETYYSCNPFSVFSSKSDVTVSKYISQGKNSEQVKKYYRDMCDQIQREYAKTDERPGKLLFNLCKKYGIDIYDQCPDNPNKKKRGVCGCKKPDIDSDGDGVLDCKDLCKDNKKFAYSMGHNNLCKQTEEEWREDQLEKKKCPKNAIAKWSDEKKKPLCYCQDGFMLSKSRKECISKEEANRKPFKSCKERGGVTIYRGSSFICLCKESMKWNKDKTKCICRVSGTKWSEKENKCIKDYRRSQDECLPEGFTGNYYGCSKYAWVLQNKTNGAHSMCRDPDKVAQQHLKCVKRCLCIDRYNNNKKTQPEGKKEQQWIAYYEDKSPSASVMKLTSQSSYDKATHNKPVKIAIGRNREEAKTKACEKLKKTKGYYSSSHGRSSIITFHCK